MMNWLRQTFGRRRLYSDLSREIQEHLDEKAEELMAAGMSREEAMAAARREFGNALLVEERSREVWRWPGVDTILAEIKYALRSLRRSPGFTITVIFILALAIGANTAVFSVVDALLLRPLPYPEPDRLAAIETHITNGRSSGDNVSEDGETWELARSQAPSLEVAAYKKSSSGVNLQTTDRVRYVQEQRVSAGYFDVLGVHPIMGRMFTPEEDLPTGPRVAVISYGLWKSTFGLDSGILGNAIHLKGEPYTVVGIMPSELQTTAPADLWTPLRPQRSGEGQGLNYYLIARLKPGASWAQANSELGRLRPQSFSYLESHGKAQAHLRAVPLQADLAYAARDTVLILLCAVSFVLLIACANLAGLFLVRVLQRGREIATRMALGASRATVLRQILIEPLILSVLGGAAALIMAAGSIGFLSRLLSSDVHLVGSLRLDARILIFTAAATLLTTLLVAFLPAWELRRVEIYSSIRGNGTSQGQTEKRRTRQVLIAAEVALTVVLLGSAGLLVRTLVYLQTLPPGFDADNVLTAQASLNDARYHDAQAFRNLLRNSVAAMKRIPGVESAAMGLTLPYEQALNSWLAVTDGADKGKQSITNEIYVTPEYFGALRIPILDGRVFADTDTAEVRPVCVLNLRLARILFGSASVLGRHVNAEGKDYEVVGVVADVTKPSGISDGGPLTTEPILYIPAPQFQQGALNAYHVWFQPSWIVRTRGPVDGLSGAMQKALAEVDPLLPFSGFHDMRDLENTALDHQRMAVFLLGTLAALALVLSLVGVYGLVSNFVTERTREIGIRMALGSTLRRTMVEIGKAGILAAGWGAAAGLALAVVAVRFLRSELFGVRPYDPVTFTATLGLLLLAVLLASLAPTLRIARIDPASTLRAE